MSSMPKFWRVTAKRLKKAHLTPFVPNEGSGITALCGQSLPEDERRGVAKTIVVPDGDECERCLIQAGFKEKPKPTPAQLAWKAVRGMNEILERVGYTRPEDKKAFLTPYLGRYHDLLIKEKADKTSR